MTIEEYLALEYARYRHSKLQQRAYQAVRRATRAGKLVNPETCERCGKDESEAHHDDYRRPLEVAWLCHPCHMQLHRTLRIAPLRRDTGGLASGARGLLRSLYVFEHDHARMRRAA